MKKVSKKWLRVILSVMMITLMLTLSVSATGDSAAGTTSSAITDVGTALTGVIGYMAQTTAAILGDDLWILILVYLLYMRQMLLRAYSQPAPVLQPRAI